MTRDQLLERIKTLAILHGEFTLRSGKKSKYYVDKYRFETQPDVLAALGKLFATHVTPEIDRIAGPELGAVCLAAATSIEANKPFIMVRKAAKEYGTTKRVEGVLNPGEKVLMVEDILTTGGAVLEAAKSLTDAGANIVKIVGVIDRLEGARENIERAGFKMDALFTIADLGIAQSP
ncbi:MAG: orotate phosphoribosyltransferase [Burkholderiales bacterium]|nr:orotate phosphoribosyltransferase [Phycisphaerae bacterium]